MDLDPSMQRILEGASNELSQCRFSQRLSMPGVENLPTRGFTTSENQRQTRRLNSFSNETHSNDFSFAPGPRQSIDRAQSLDCMGRDSFAHEPSYHQPVVPIGGPARISLPTRRSYTLEIKGPGSIANADNYFGNSQHERQGGVTINPSQQRVADAQPFQSPISQLATNMVFQRVMPSRTFMPEPSVQQDSTTKPASFYQKVNLGRLQQLQPSKQQLTPPFNLSGFKYSSKDQQSPAASSPFAPNSSPTTQVTLRRATNRAAPSSKYIQEEDGFDENVTPVTPLRQTQTPSQNSQGSSHMANKLSLKHAPPMAHGIQLVSPYELPDRFRRVFPYELFNAAQSKCFEPIYKSNDNVLVSAPTGCGKTALLELAICKLVVEHRSGEFKIVYQAPTKSLCSERMRDWEKKFSHLNLSCAELTGDTSHYDMAKVRNASIIITTPEKWDSLTRKWKDHQKLLLMVKLFLIDEIHILKDARGATLEAVVSRMKGSGANVRIVALSATVPNSEDIAAWLGKNSTEDDIPAHRQVFGEDFRPVKLQKHVYGFDGQANDFVFEKVLDGKLPGLIQKHTQKKPVMVFCLTRKACEKTAVLLAEWWTRQRVVDRAWPAPTRRTRVDKKELQEVISCGVSFHHAGLDQQDRYAVENSYLEGDISVICCTSTLAMGINLPCHLVVLKGTVGYQGGGGPTELSDLEVMQMLGRAGRPQFDDNAVAIIMTRKDKVNRYQKMISGQDTIESTLHLNLIEHFNSEVSLGSIKTVHQAKKWLLGTFWSVRMRLNPNYYRLEGIPPSTDTDHCFQLVCERNLKLLQDNQLVMQSDFFSCTEYGNAMSRYMVSFNTMITFLRLSQHAKTEEILQLLCQASEFQDLRLKAIEKTGLREVNKSPFIKFPIREPITATAHKISLIIQAQLGGVDFPKSSKDGSNNQGQYYGQYSTEKNIIFERIQRLVRCIIDCKSYDCDAIATRHALDLARSLAAEYWENSNLQLRQVPQIGPATNQKLAAGNISSVEQLASMNTADIERIMSRNPPYGRRLLDTLIEFPRLTLTAEIIGKLFSKPGENPKIKIRACLGFRNTKIPLWQKKRPSLTFMAESSNGTLVFFWRANISKLDKGTDVEFMAELCGPEDEFTCHIACDQIVGTIQSFKLTPNIPESAFPPPKTVKKTKNAIVEDNQNEIDEFGGDDFNDDDMIAAVKDADVAGDYSSDEFVEIAEMDTISGTKAQEIEETASALESVQMDNGRWTCNHTCGRGNLLKNGQTCKHKCCAEGLEKPRKPRKRSSYLTSEISSSMNKMQPTANRSQMNNKLSKSNSNHSKRGDQEQEEVGLIDLTDWLSPVSYPKLASRDYPKLHKLHTNVQDDKNERISKQKPCKPQYSNTTGSMPDFTFMKDSHTDDDAIYSIDDDPFFSFDDDMSTGSALVTSKQSLREAANLTFDSSPSGGPIESIDSGSIENLEAAMLDLTDSLVVRASPAPRVDTSFENKIFDFEAFDESPQKREMKEDLFSSPLMGNTLARSQPRQTIPKDQSVSQSPQYAKRLNSFSPGRLDVKHRRVTREEGVGLESVGEEPFKQDDAEGQSRPAWVDEMDPDIIQSLIGIVEFVE